MTTTISGVIEAFGGHPAFVSRFGIARQAVHHWKTRGYFPGHMYLPMCAWAEERGVEIDPALFHFERKPRRRKTDVSAAARR